MTARFLVNASGVLTVPNLPDIDGVGDFAGITMHTARWDHSQDLTGKRVAIIGTGASAVQVIPEIAPIVQSLKVFQRTPIWCMPKFDVPLPAPARWAMRIPGGKLIQRALSQAYVELTFTISAQYYTVFPLARRAETMGRAYLKRQVHDPEVRDKLTPRYAVGCKRPGFHNSYLSTYNRDNVELVTEPIDEVTGSGVVTTDGAVRDVDVPDPGDRIQGDGRRQHPDVPRHRRPRQIAGRILDRTTPAGLRGCQHPRISELLHRDGPLRLRGLVLLRLIETQTHHIVRCLKRAVSEAATRVEVSQDANDRFFAEMMSKRHRQIFWQDSCALANSYYFDKNGDVPLRPTTTAEALVRSRRFPLSDYEFTG